MDENYGIAIVEYMMPNVAITDLGPVEINGDISDSFGTINLGDEILVANLDSGKPTFLTKLRTDPRMITGEDRE